MAVRVAPGRLEVAGGLSSSDEAGLGRFASTLTAGEDVSSPSGVFSGEERSGELSLGSAFISSLKLISSLTFFFPGCGRRILLMLTLVWIAERGSWGSSRAK
jgi:hypothetical protein